MATTRRCPLKTLTLNALRRFGFPRFVLASVALFSLLGFVPCNSHATPGDLDSTFGTAGISVKQVANDVTRSVVVQSDGKIVLVGFSSLVSDTSIILLRFNSDGTLDTSFGTNGVTTTTIEPSANSWAVSAALQSDGKIVVVGHYYKSADSTLRMYVARYTAHGVLDSTFNADGVATPTIPGGTDDRATGVAIQSDGKIVVAVDSMNATNAHRFVVLRLTSSGDLDPSFGAAGVVIQALSAQQNAPTALALQPDGKIVVTGYTFDGAGSYADYATLRLNTDGSLDSGFGSGGVVVTSICSSNDYARAVALQSDGKILVGGSSHDRSGHSFSAARYNTDGSLDTNYNSTGIVTTAIGASDVAQALVVHADGKMLLAGYSDDGAVTKFALARYTTTGALDTSFHSTGIVTTSFSNTNDRVYAAALQADGKIVVGGNVAPIPSGDLSHEGKLSGANLLYYTSFVAARYMAEAPPSTPALGARGLLAFGLLLLGLGLGWRRAKA